MNNSLKKELFSEITNRQALIMVFGYIFLMVILAIVLQQTVDREWLRQVVSDTGNFGLIIFFLIEYIYIILVPVYNTTIHLAAGYIFGGDIGWVLNFLATSAGLFTIIYLVKRFGRPLLQRIVPSRIYNRYDDLSHRIGPITLFLVYVLPLFPDDEITYLIAAGQVRFARFVLPVLLGNVTKAAVSYIGDEGMAGFQMALGTRVIVLVIGIILIGIQEYWFSKIYGKQNKPEHGDKG